MTKFSEISYFLLGEFRAIGEIEGAMVQFRQQKTLRTIDWKAFRVSSIFVIKKARDGD
jgi:hypothetical protein